MVGSAAPADSNPPLLICDTDALVQLLLAGDVTALRDLRRLYHIQPSIVEAVNFELISPQSRSLQRLQPMYEAAFDKALGNGTLQVADERTLPAYVGSAAHAVWNEVSIRATSWATRVQRGEAYSHSLALSLKLPVLTHDMSAVKVLRNAGEALSSPILRLFDLYAFAFQRGSMTESDCDNCRQILVREKQALPDAFRNRAFLDGLSQFYPRLQCASTPPVGYVKELEIDDVRLLITPASKTEGDENG